MKAWRVHDFGEPQDRFVLDEVPEPTGADLAGMSMSLGGWVPAGPGLEPFDDWVIMRMRVAALALPDVTMCRGTYPVTVRISMIFEVPEHMSDEQAAGFLIAGHTAHHAAIRRGGVAAGETVVVLG